MLSSLFLQGSNSWYIFWISNTQNNAAALADVHINVLGRVSAIIPRTANSKVILSPRWFETEPFWNLGDLVFGTIVAIILEANNLAKKRRRALLCSLGLWVCGFFLGKQGHESKRPCKTSKAHSTLLEDLPLWQLWKPHPGSLHRAPPRRALLYCQASEVGGWVLLSRPRRFKSRVNSCSRKAGLKSLAWANWNITMAFLRSLNYLTSSEVFLSSSVSFPKDLKHCLPLSI